MRAREKGRRGKTLSRTKSSKYSTIPTYTAPKGTRTAILATLGYIEETSRKWTKYESESSLKFSPFSTVRFSVKSRSTHVENRMGLRATWLVASNGGTKSDPLSPRDKSKIWHQKDSLAKDDTGGKSTWQNSIDAKCVLYSTENDHASIFIHYCLCDCYI